VTDIVASTPSLLLLLFARALLPLNVAPEVSVAITFLLLGAMGWTSGVRVFAAAAAGVRDSDYLRQAVASGCRPARIICLHTVAAVRPVVAAQFLVLVPVFLLAEANLGMLGLGVSEPLPSLGNLLSEVPLTTAIGSQPWVLAPAALLLIVLLGLQGLLVKETA
jgi:ABC-type dipeptide/oligopeptide/nickel transport system permease subunit